MTLLTHRKLASLTVQQPPPIVTHCSTYHLSFLLIDTLQKTILQIYRTSLLGFF